MKIVHLIKGLIVAIAILAITAITFSVLSSGFTTNVVLTYEERIEFKNALMDMYLSIYRLFHLSHNYVVTLNEDYLQRYREELALDSFNAGRNTFIQLGATDAELTALNQMLQHYNDFIAINEEGIQLATTNWEEAILLLHNPNYSRIFIDLDHMLDEITSSMLSRMTIEIDAGMVYKDLFNMLSSISILLSSLGGLVALIVILRKFIPIEQLKVLVRDVASGNFNSNVKTSTATDEIGELTVDIHSLIQIIETLLQDMDKFIYEYNIKGNISYRTNTDNYQGEYKKLVQNVNNITDVVTDDVNVFLGVIRKVGKGNFDVQIPPMPGDKIIANHAIDALAENLKNVNTAINSMIKAISVDGDTAFRIDETGYEGDWQTIISGLNAISHAVNVPIQEIKSVILHLEQGNFGSKVTGNYFGDFLTIKNAINQTTAELSDIIKQLRETLSELATGNLTSTIIRDYPGDFAEIKQSVNNISRTLSDTMHKINVSSQEILQQATKVSQTSSVLADTVTNQASTIEELNSSLDVINGQTVQNAEDAAAANAISDKSAKNALTGNSAMNDLFAAMLEIKDSANNISRIINVIQDIAFQTNLLALNASVEAARAGEHGKGFAVVAEEVRSLATRSQTAATETATLINNSIEKVEIGTSIAESAQETLTVIVKNAQEVLQIVNGISNSSKEQAISIGELLSGITQISQIVQNNSQISTETSVTADKLNDQAIVLEKLVSYFKL
ncbi:MAG: methyl-accepting chemotaxis protein [Firmicutes bacterium]|nr:methyl-accepting chemotaxis protein [Bacillota bacterium]